MSARLPASSVREITRVAAHRGNRRWIGVERGGKADRAGTQHVCAPAEDQLRAGLVRRSGHGAVQLHHDPTTRHTRHQRGGHRDLLGAPGESEDVLGFEPAHQQCGRGATHARECCRASGRTDVDAVPGHHRFSQAESAFELTLLIGVQIVTHVGRHDDLDAHQPLGLRPCHQPARGRPRDAEAGCDLGLGQAVEVVQRRCPQCESKVLRRRGTALPGCPSYLAVRRRCGHECRPTFPSA